MGDQSPIEEPVGEIVVNRRRTVRNPVHVDVTCSLGGIAFSGTTRNLTTHGLFVESTVTLAVDAEVELKLELPDSDVPAKLSGRVVRIASAERDRGPSGIGIEFAPMDEATHARIAAFVQQAEIDRSAPSGA